MTIALPTALGASFECYVGKSNRGFFFTATPVETDHGLCPIGFYCPNSTKANTTLTAPRFCPPSLECLSKRRSRELCPPQGPLEPIVCPKGYYCPKGDEMKICPEDYYCPLGTYEPIECGYMMHCPEGIDDPYDYSCILYVIVIDAIFVVLYSIIRYRRTIFHNRSTKTSPMELHEADLLFSKACHIDDTELTAIIQEMAASAKSLCGSHCSSEERSILHQSPKTDVTVENTADYVHALAIVSAGIRCNRAGMKPLDLNFSELSVIVKGKNGADIQLLKGISGSIQPGRVTAIMGPSGAGKTVFMTRLLGKFESSWHTDGELNINGYCSNLLDYQHVIGYVPQDDVLHEELTVYENIWFAASTRLPKEWSANAVSIFVNAVIKVTGLEDVQHRIVGDGITSNSGVSRKRTSVAIELASAPSALFLDEPTTGLDASTALDLCGLLKDIARTANVTVTMVIHQPRVEIWDSLDEILLLAPGGKTVYQGPQKNVGSYFAEVLGLRYEDGNPADIILDGITNAIQECEMAWQRVRESDNNCGETGNVDSTTSKKNYTIEPPQKVHASFLRQIVLIHYRSILKQSYHVMSVILAVLLSILTAVIMACAGIQVEMMLPLLKPYSVLSSNHNAYVIPMLCMFYSLAIACTSSGAIRAFGDDRQQFWKEMSTGRYNRIAYFIGTVSGELYRLLMIANHFTIVVYLMWNPYISFWKLYLILLLCFLANDSQSAMLSLVVTPRYAPLLTTLSNVLISLCNGFPQVPVLYNIAYTYYATNAIVWGNYEYVDHIFIDSVYRDRFHYKRRHYGLDVLILLFIIVIYRVTTFALMTLLHRNKQK